MHIDRRLLRSLRPVRAQFILCIALGLFRALTIIGQAWFLARILYDVFLGRQSLENVQTSLIFFAGLSLLRFAASWGGEAAAAGVAAQVKTDLRRRLFEALGTQEHQTRLGQQSGEVANTLTQGIDTLDAYFSQYLPQLFLALLAPVAILCFVFPVDALSGWVLLLTAPLIPFFMMLIGGAAKTLTDRQWTALSRLSAHFLDVIRGLPTLKAFHRAKDQVQVIDRITDEFRQATMQVLRVAFLSALVLEMLATLSTAIVAVEIGIRLLYARIAFDQALFVLLLAPEFFLPLRQLGSRFHAGMEGVSAAQRIFEVLESSPPPTPRCTPPPPSPAEVGLIFEEITFRYQSRVAPALDQVSFALEPGTTLALVGPSGAGKTTTALLLLGFLRPEKGSIRLGKTSLADVDRAAWHRHVAWVPQRPTLFHQSIRENLLLAAPTADDATLLDALDRVALGELIRTLPEGLDTRLGERATRLSGGQAQRLALARAFLQRDASLLILDEPTAHLDPDIENRVQEAVAELRRNRTTLLITHRLQTARDADQILLLRAGRIQEAGSHTRLLEADGAYAALWTAFRGAMAG